MRLLQILGLVAGLALPVGAAAADTESEGAKVFSTNCQVCHQPGGTGVPGAFPRLAGRAPVIAASPDGRRFLAQLVITGMSGSVMVDGQRIMGVMPGFAQLSDAELASVLTYVSSLEAPKHKAAAFKASDIAAARSKTKSTAPSDTATLRNTLAGRKLIP